MFSVWCFAPYAVHIALASTVSAIKDSSTPFPMFFSLRTQAMLLVPLAIPAFAGTILLCSLPLQRRWLAVIAGIILASCGVAGVAYFEIKFFGGFEETPDILVNAMLMLLPSCAAGVYAGRVRSESRR